MNALRRLISVLLISICLSNAAAAQTPPKVVRAPEPTVTASAIPTGVRFAAPNRVARLKLEVLSVDGEALLEVSSQGSVLDWTLHDGNGQLLSDGSYLCVVTVKSLNGKISQRVGTMSMIGGVVTLQAEIGLLTAAQQHAVGPIEENGELTVLQEEGAPAAAVVAHDGRDGQVTSTTGALTFRTGDVFAGKEKEQMRLTEDGRLGIGTSDPQAKLDVAGTIRAQRFLIARPKVTGADNTEILTTDATATDSAEVEALVAGSGTQNRIAKWVDNAGTLGDSVIAESSGNIGIGTTIPTHKLDVQNTGANGAIRSVNETAGVRGLISEQHSSNVVGAIFVGLKSRGTLAAPTAVVPNDFGAFFSNKWYDGTSYVQSGAFGFTVDGPVSQGVVPTRLSFVTSTTSGDGATAHGVERMTILSGGNVGIGTLSPSFRLHVIAADAGLRVQTDNYFGQVASFGGFGDFQIDSPFAPGGRFTVKSSELFGRVGIGTNSPQAVLDLKGGADSDGTIDPKAIAFQYRGGGFRHWIRTRHNSNLGSGNAIDFFVNNSATADGSTGPGLGSGSAHVMTLDSGRVGIGGITNPTETLSVEGKIESTFGGFKFPDASVQTTAAANATYTTVNDTDLALGTTGEIALLHLNLPAGTYLLNATSGFFNAANYFNADNSRQIMCRFSSEGNGLGDEGYRHRATIQGLTRVEMSFHSIVTIPTGGVDVLCRAFNYSGDLIAEQRRLTAVKLSGDVIVQ